MAETNNTPEEIKVQGVRKSIIEERLNDYRRKVYEYDGKEIRDLETELESATAMEIRAQGRLEDDPENPDRQAQYKAIQERVQDIARRLKEARENAEKNPKVKDAEYYRMADVIPELEDILANADPNLEYIPLEEIQRRLQVQRDLKARLEAEQRDETPGLSDEEIASLQARIAELRIQSERYAALIENEAESRAILEQEKEELEARIREIRAALENSDQEQGEGKDPLSDEERQELEDKLSAARSALGANNDTLTAKLSELDELKRQRDEEIARHNGEEKREVLKDFAPEDGHTDDEKVKAEYAARFNVPVEEIVIERTEVEVYDDGPLNEYRIVRVTKVNESILTADERALVEKEISDTEKRITEIDEARKLSLDKMKDLLRANLSDEINDVTTDIVNNNQSYANSERRMEANEPLFAKRTALEERRKALDNITPEQMVSEIDLQITYLRGLIVKNNETYGTTERRVEANNEVNRKIAELQNYKKEIDNLKNDKTAAERNELETKLAKLREKLEKDDALRAKNPKLQELNAKIAVREEEIEKLREEIAALEKEIAEYEEQIKEDDKAKAAKTGKKGLTDEEKAKLEAELKEKETRVGEIDEALNNPDKTKAYMISEKERIDLLIQELVAKIEKAKGTKGKDKVDNSEAIRIADNKIKELEELEKLKEEFTVKKEPIKKGDPIPIPPIEDIPIELDEDRIKDEYLRRKHDMYAKYYGDKDYQAEYDERAARFREHEREALTEDGKSYRTVEDYPEKAEDERFLLLENYQEALERMTKDQAGITVYAGTPEEIEAQRAKDKEYVETRNHTFDQHKYTQRDLATLGKYGEKMPYIPKQNGLLRNIGRGLLNAGIFARNVVAPVYRFVGKTIAQPLHRLITRGKDASPYRNNFYHRMVARREYFAEQGRLRDEQATRELMEKAAPGEEVVPVKNTLRNWGLARWNAIFKSREGNEAVLNAGEHDIQTNIIRQEKADATVRALEASRESMARQIQEMQEALDKNPNAPNAEEVRQAIQDRQAKIDSTQKSIEEVLGIREETKQTDAVSDRTHAIARKEINTLRTMIIKGVAKGVAAKYIGPAIEKWILDHSKIKTQEWVEPTTEQKWVEETTRQEWVKPSTKQEWVEETIGETTVPVYDDRLPGGKSVRELINEKAGTSYTGYRTVSGGQRGAAGYTLSGDEKITGWWVDDGTKWGTGVSDRAGLTAPTLTDRLAQAGLMDANGVFRQDIEPEEILRICKMEGIDVNKVYISVGDKHWAKAADIFGVEKVQVGEEVIRDVIPGHWETKEIPGFWDTITEPGHWDTVTVPGYMKDVIITNPRVAHFIQGGKVVARTAMVADTVHNVAENLRNTHTDVKENKPQPREYQGDPELSEIFGEFEEHPTSKYEYEQRRRDRDDDEHEM